jgi:hypothetical protein
MSPEMVIKRNLQKSFPDVNIRYACMALVLTPKMLVFTFATVAVLVLAETWIDHVLYNN